MEGGLSGDDSRKNPEKLHPREGKETLEDIDRGVSETIREIAGPEEAREIEEDAEKLDEHKETKRTDEGIDGAIRDTIGENEAKETQEELKETDDNEIDEGVGQAIRDTVGEEKANEVDEEEERLEEEVTDEKIEDVIEETLEERDQENIGEEVERIIEEVEQEVADGSNELVGEGDEGREQDEDIGDEEIEEPPDPELDSLEEKVLETFEEHGIDKEEVRERMEERFRKDVAELLEEENKLDEETGAQGEEGTEGRTAAGQGAHIETGDGTVQVMVIPSDEGAKGTETEESETGEELPAKEEHEEADAELEPEHMQDTAEEVEEKQAVSEAGEIEVEQKEPEKELGGETSENVESEEVREQPEEGIRRERRADSKAEAETSKEVESEKLEQNVQKVREELEEECEDEEVEEETAEGGEGAEKRYTREVYAPQGRISLAGNEGLVNPMKRNLQNPYSNPEEELRKLRYELYKMLPEEERMKLEGEGKGNLQTREDYERLLKRFEPELKDRLGIEEKIEEGRRYLRFKEILREREGQNIDIGEVAAEVKITVEQAEAYRDGEVPPIITDLWNYEIEYQWAKKLRRAMFFGSKEELYGFEGVLKEHPDLLDDSVFEEDMGEARIWVEIMQAKDQGDIEFVVKGGREVFQKEQVLELADKHEMGAEKVLGWLLDMRRPEVILRVGEGLFVIRSREKRLSERQQDEGIEEAGAPSKEFLKNFPENNDDFEWMVSRHAYLKECKIFEAAYKKVLIYIELKTRQRRGELDGISQRELSKQYGVGRETIRKWLNGLRKPRLVEMLLHSEELRRKYEKEELGSNALPHRISPAVLYWVFEDLQGRKDIPVEVLTDCVLQLYRLAGEPIGVRFADFNINYKPIGSRLRSIGEMLKQKQEEVEVNLNKRLGLDIDFDMQLRIGMTNSKLYFRMHNRRWQNWFNLYKNELFYFESVEDKVALIDETYARLGSIGGTHFSRLVEQITDYGAAANESHRNSDLSTKSNHVRGETLHLILDVNGLRIQDIQNQIHHVGRTREGKSGTIVNPKFPADSEMIDIILARIVGAAVSDGHIPRKGKGFRYYEKYDARVEIFLGYMSALGDVKYKDNDKENGIWIIRFPSVVGRMLERIGVTAGDSCIQNNGLPEFVLKGSLRVKCVYLSQLWVEDGCFCKARRNPFPTFSWKRTVVLYDASKVHMYDVKGQISKNLIHLFNEHGSEKKSATPKGNPGMVIYREKLQGLRRDENTQISNTADKLWKLADSSESTLLNDEIKLLEDLGVCIDPRLIRVTYYENSGRISAEWGGRVDNPEDVMLICLLAPPDDNRKRESVEEWVKSEPLLEKKVLEQIEDEGLKWIMEE